MKWSVTLTDRLGPEMLTVLEIKGQVLHRVRLHVKVQLNTYFLYHSPLDSTEDGSVIITERIYFILESIELHGMFSKSLMDRLSARLLYSPRIYSSTMDPVDFEERYF